MRSDSWPTGDNDGDGYDTMPDGEDEEDWSNARSNQLAEEIIRLGVTAVSLPAAGGNGWQPGVWLDAEAAGQVISALRLK